MLEIPPQYHSTIVNYVNFVHGWISLATTISNPTTIVANPTAETVKVTAKPARDPVKLANYFRMNTFIDVPDYFKFLMQQLLGNWSTIASQSTTATAISTTAVAATAATTIATT